MAHKSKRDNVFPDYFDISDFFAVANIFWKTQILWRTHFWDLISWTTNHLV